MTKVATLQAAPPADPIPEAPPVPRVIRPAARNKISSIGYVRSHHALDAEPQHVPEDLLSNEFWASVSDKFGPRDRRDITRDRYDTIVHRSLPGLCQVSAAQRFVTTSHWGRGSAERQSFAHMECLRIW